MPLSLPDPPPSDGVVALRLIDERDLPTIERASRDPEIASRFGLSKLLANEYLVAYQRGWNQGTAAAFAIDELGHDRAALGQVMLELRQAGRADVGYWLLREGRGRGLATRGLRLMSEWALDQLDIARLQLWTSPENTSSQRVAEQSGFQREGVLRAYGERDDGSRVDAVFFSLLPADLDQRGAASPRFTSSL